MYVCTLHGSTSGLQQQDTKNKEPVTGVYFYMRTPCVLVSLYAHEKTDFARIQQDVVR